MILIRKLAFWHYFADSHPTTQQAIIRSYAFTQE